MPAQTPQSARAAFNRLPVSAKPRTKAPAAAREPNMEAATAEAERIRAELIVSKIVAHTSPQALIAALMKHIDTDRA